jgi:hypothetical protein
VDPCGIPELARIWELEAFNRIKLVVVNLLEAIDHDIRDFGMNGADTCGEHQGTDDGNVFQFASLG